MPANRLGVHPARMVAAGRTLLWLVLWPAMMIFIAVGLADGQPAGLLQARTAAPLVDHHPPTVDAPTAGEEPNVVSVMADDMRADDLRFMPHVRRLLVARGLDYRNSFSPYPLCCPARASFLTGQYAHNHHVLDNESPYGFGGFDDRATLATALRDAGYRTAFVGKYLNDYGLVPSLVTGEPSATYVPAGWTDWRGLIQPDEPVGAGTYHYFHPLFNVDGRVRDYGRQYQTTLLGRFARELVTSYAAGDRPFFLYLSALAPHHGLPVEEALLVLDLEVARLVRTLRVTGELDDTVVVMTSDNGYFLGEHHRRTGKKLPYEPSLRVPLVIAGPGVPRGRRFDPVKTPDLTATILDLAGAVPPHPADGTSLVSNMRHGDQGWSTPVVTEAIANHATPGAPAAAAARGFRDARTTVGLRTARYQPVRWVSGVVELCALHRDPNELHNVTNDPRYAVVRERLTRLWWRYKDCVAAACARTLPARFQTGPTALAAQTVRQAAGVRAWWSGG